MVHGWVDSEMISIVIVTHESRSDIGQCIQSIEKCRPNRPYEIVVVDNASSDGCAEYLLEEFPNVNVVIGERRRGFRPIAMQE